MGKLIVTILVMINSAVCFGQIAVIANKSVPLNKIERSRLLDYYTGDLKRWSNNKPAVVFDLKQNDDLKENFYKYLGKTTIRIKSIWLKKMLSGEGEPPKALDTENDMLSSVVKTPGSIGFIHKDKVTDSVKVLLEINF